MAQSEIIRTQKLKANNEREKYIKSEREGGIEEIRKIKYWREQISKLRLSA
jgi:hypothetical protein